MKLRELADLRVGDVAVFLTVARCGKVQGAARELELPPSQVARDAGARAAARAADPALAGRRRPVRRLPHDRPPAAAGVVGLRAGRGAAPRAVRRARAGRAPRPRTGQLVFGPTIAAREHVRRGTRVEVLVAGWDRTEELFLAGSVDRVWQGQRRAIIDAVRGALDEVDVVPTPAPRLRRGRAAT